MLFVSGFILGFVGYLPPGSINLTVVQLSISEQGRRWQWFVALAALMEFIYCFFSLSGIQVLRHDTDLILGLNWSSVVIFFVLGMLSLLQKEKPESKKELFSPGLRRGILVAIFNPLQIPFWLVFGAYVMENNWVKDTYVSIAMFSAVCTFGTTCVLYMYAVAGKNLVERLNINRNVLNRVIGVLLLSLAVIQTGKLLMHS